MATIAPQEISKAGAVITLAPANGGGDKFQAGPGLMLRVKNGDSGSHNVTVARPVPCSMGFNHDLVVAVAAGATEEIGPFPSSEFADALGFVNLTYSAVTSVTVGVVHLPGA